MSTPPIQQTSSPQLPLVRAQDEVDAANVLTRLFHQSVEKNERGIERKKRAQPMPSQGVQGPLEAKVLPTDRAVEKRAPQGPPDEQREVKRAKIVPAPTQSAPQQTAPAVPRETKDTAGK